MPGYPRWWSVFISLNGLALIWYEAVLSNFDRPWLLAVAGGMIGVLPASVLDGWIGRRGSGEAPPPSPPPRSRRK